MTVRSRNGPRTLLYPSSEAIAEAPQDPLQVIDNPEDFLKQQTKS